MTRLGQWLATAYLFVALWAQAAPSVFDGGVVLSAAECDALLGAMITLSVNEALASDPDVKKMNAQEKAATARLSHARALADPKLTELKQQCPARYSPPQRDCILKATTMTAIDECSKRQR